MLIKNTESGEWEDVPEDRAAALLKDDRYLIQPGIESVLVSPSGQRISAKDKSIYDAVNKGYRFETKEETRLRDLDEEYGGPLGQLGAAALGFTRGVIPGVDFLYSAVGGEELIRNLEEANPTTATAATAVGAIGGSITGVGAFGQAAKVTSGAQKVGSAVASAAAGTKLDKASKVLGSAAAVATEGAFYGAYQPLTDIALGDPEMTAEEAFIRIAQGMGEGAIFGAAIGGGLSAAGQALKKVAAPLSKTKKDMAGVIDGHHQASRTQMGFEDWVAKRTAQQVGRSEDAIKKFIRDPKYRELASRPRKELVNEIADDLVSVRASVDDAFDSAMDAVRTQLPTKLEREVSGYAARPALEEARLLLANLNLPPATGILDDGVLSKNIFKFFYTIPKDKLDDVGRDAIDVFLGREDLWGPAGRLYQRYSTGLNRLRNSPSAQNVKKLYRGDNKLSSDKMRNFVANIEDTGKESLKDMDAVNLDRMKFIDEVEELFGTHPKLKEALGAEQKWATAIKESRSKMSANRLGSELKKATGSDFFEKLVGAGALGGGILAGGAGGGVAGALGAAVFKAAKDLATKPAVYAQRLAGLRKWQLEHNERVLKTAKRILKKPTELGQKILDPQGATVRSGVIKRATEIDEEQLQDRTSRARKIKEFLNAAASATADPVQAYEQTAAAYEDIGSFAPAVAAAMTQKRVNALNFLNSKANEIGIPRNRMGQWETPTETQLERFEEVINAINNPDSVYNDIANGTASVEAVDALRFVFPKSYEKLVNSVMEELPDDPSELDMRTLNALETLLGYPQEDWQFPEVWNTMQASYAVRGMTEGTNVIRSGRPRSISATTLQNITQEQQTQGQRAGTAETMS